MGETPRIYICEPCGDQMSIDSEISTQGKIKTWISCENCQYRVSVEAMAEIGELIPGTNLAFFQTYQCPKWVKNFLQSDNEAAHTVAKQMGHMEVVINPEERINFADFEKTLNQTKEPRVAIEPKNFKGNRNERRRNKKK